MKILKKKSNEKVVSQHYGSNQDIKWSIVEYTWNSKAFLCG